mmetsp:Transcript_112057/g.327748  ORF Transcript_112057/g.327748 Transcript_112057/m.327748 type:complete len:543 (+) Transcript_112057:518-2146(+)
MHALASHESEVLALASRVLLTVPVPHGPHRGLLLQPPLGRLLLSGGLGLGRHGPLRRGGGAGGLAAEPPQDAAVLLHVLPAVELVAEAAVLPCPAAIAEEVEDALVVTLVWVPGAADAPQRTPCLRGPRSVGALLAQIASCDGGGGGLLGDARHRGAAVRGDLLQIVLSLCLQAASVRTQGQHHELALRLLKLLGRVGLQDVRVGDWLPYGELAGLHLDPGVDVAGEDAPGDTFELLHVHRVAQINVNVGDVGLDSDDVPLAANEGGGQAEEVGERLAVLPRVRQHPHEVPAQAHGLPELPAHARLHNQPAAQEAAVLAHNLLGRVARQRLEALRAADERAVLQGGIRQGDRAGHVPDGADRHPLHHMLLHAGQGVHDAREVHAAVPSHGLHLLRLGQLELVHLPADLLHQALILEQQRGSFQAALLDGLEDRGQLWVALQDPQPLLLELAAVGAGRQPSCCGVWRLARRRVRGGRLLRVDVLGLLNACELRHAGRGPDGEDLGRLRGRPHPAVAQVERVIRVTIDFNERVLHVEARRICKG